MRSEIVHDQFIDKKKEEKKTFRDRSQSSKLFEDDRAIKKEHKTTRDNIVPSLFSSKFFRDLMRQSVSPENNGRSLGFHSL